LSTGSGLPQFPRRDAYRDDLTSQTEKQFKGKFLLLILLLLPTLCVLGKNHSDIQQYLSGHYGDGIVTRMALAFKPARV